MKKVMVAVLAAFAAAAFGLSAHAATINQVIVRQQWPWSTDVKVEYQLEGVDASHPVDLAVTAYNGDTPLSTANLASAIKGDIYGITEEFGEFYIDPIAAFGSERIAMTKFKVKLAVSESASNIGEVLYKIFCLTNSSEAVVNVTRRDLLNGKYGSYETDYSKFGTGFASPLSDVLVWTGVTNDAKYATTHLVLRKIPAKGQTFTMGSPVGEIGRVDTDTATMPSGRETQHEVSFTNDFYIGVFELTQYQWWLVKKAWPSSWAAEGCRDERPVEHVSFVDICGASQWPADISHTAVDGSFMAGLCGMVAESPRFDLPTEAQWEYACRAKSTSAYYNGKGCENAASTYNSANLNALGRYRVNGGYPDGEYPTSEAQASSDTSGGTARVGSYMPNAWGLYDMLGNVCEWCLDWYAASASGAVTEPTGPVQEDSWMPATGAQYNHRVMRGGFCTSAASECRSASRLHNTTSTKHLAGGFRVCITLTEE